MGKKGRRTRWRTLTITDEHSDSEESNTTSSGHRVPKGYPQKSYYSRFTYSSQSTPTRRYQCDGTKSTRSSSTASENKITFNEDEYTRITTPRQDVLFKKGYLNKPKTYQTQTSTGTSTTSTGNSTGNGTPDHQSTDLEYESQFVFPNGFVDQNGIYYVNSFEPYPLMVYNPPTYYPEFSNVKAKRCSTGSLTESTSPNNEEASQDLSQSETSNNVSDFSQVYNVIYPGFYYNGACQPQDVASQSEPRRMKKRRRKKVSKSSTSVQDGTTSEYTDESSDEVFSDHPETTEQETKAPDSPTKTEEESIEEGKNEETEDGPKLKYDLKPDAEEFVPRAYRQQETIPIEPNVQFIKIPSSFVPVPILNPLGEFNGQINAFIPPGIPINFIPQNYINFIPNYTNKTEDTQTEKTDDDVKKVEEKEAQEEKEETTNIETVEVPKNQIDIAKIVSKLEEAAKEQDKPQEEVPEDKPNTDTPKPSNKKPNFKRNRYQKVDIKPITDPEVKKPLWKQPPSPKKDTKTETIPKPITRNYSETLKKPPTQICERHERNMERSKNAKATPKEIIIKNHIKTEENINKTPNQWIAVSNRKKRKNKNVEETDDFEDDKDKDLFESYDVNLLEDVVMVPPPPPPPLPPEPIKIEIKENPTLEIKEEKPKPIPKKKTKRNQKPATKRVIIKDVDLSSVEKEVEDIPKLEVMESKIEEKKEEVIEQKIEIIEEKKETPEKKSKKKKKKIVKVTVLSSQSSSNTTLNVVDDSYDFLLENSILDESHDKTNVEVSQELDKMIQRGMYSSLEEKIKSLNIESNDGFFKTVIHNISSRESSVEKNFAKTPDFTTILTNTPNLLKNKPMMMEPPKNCDFLGETTPKTTIGGKEETEIDSLYPITKAVKEWMTKARETTPDVELLKSPSEILREFGEKKNGDCDDDVTIYSLSREGSEDLLDGWEDDLTLNEPKKTSSSSMEEGEDVVDVYDSKYGKNEDYLKIKEEIEEKKTNYPKHGNLPYRAICCSIM